MVIRAVEKGSAPVPSLHHSIPPQAPPSDRTRTVLVVDDEPGVAALIEQRLIEQGFAVTAQTSPRRALEEALTRRFDALLVDRLMDEMSGEELMEEVLDRRPSAVVILMTAQPDVPSAVDSMQAGAFDYVSKPLDFSALAACVRRAIERSELRDENASLQEIIRGLANAIEAKDPYTRGHGDRVATVSLMMGQALGLSRKDLDILAMAACLHDVGKIGIPDHILLKRGPLSESERREVCKHPEIGARIVAPISGLKVIERCILEHHERWDGHGYPYGLAAEQIDPLSRILILSEVFDALAHERAYKPAWSRERVADFFRQEAGGHFDPGLVPVILQLIDTRWPALKEARPPLSDSGTSPIPGQSAPRPAGAGGAAPWRRAASTTLRSARLRARA